jgi:hypothetical protein
MLTRRAPRVGVLGAGCALALSLLAGTPAMALNSTPTPGVTPNGTVFAIAPTPNAIYLGGSFTQIGGKSRRHIAALDPTTGAVKSWNPGANGPIYSIAPTPSTIYAGGSFTSIGGKSRTNLAALRPSDGSATGWNPKPTRYAGISTLAVSGPRVYVGGIFISIGGKARHNLAAVSRSSGTATSWNPHPTIDSTDSFPEPQIFDLRVTGSTVYVGGYFDHVGGRTRHLIAALDATTGVATPWNPHPTGGLDTHHPPYVSSIRVAGSTVYVGGYFNHIGGNPRSSIAALDSATGSATSWNPDAGFNDLDEGPNVQELLVSGQTVYASGVFDQIGGQARDRLAGLDRASGAADGWNPGPDEAPFALAHGPDGSLWAGGDFTGFSTLPSQPNLARFAP